MSCYTNKFFLQCATAYVLDICIRYFYSSWCYSY